jgi:hypothetical protein
MSLWKVSIIRNSPGIRYLLQRGEESNKVSYVIDLEYSSKNLSISQHDCCMWLVFFVWISNHEILILGNSYESVKCICCNVINSTNMPYRKVFWLRNLSLFCHICLYSATVLYAVLLRWLVHGMFFVILVCNCNIAIFLIFFMYTSVSKSLPYDSTRECNSGRHHTANRARARVSTRVYPKVSGLATWNEKCKWYSSLPLGAVVSLFFESV